MIFNNALIKYNLYRKKFYDQKYNISSSELFELILTKKINKPKFHFFEFLTNLISLILSIITIVKCKFLNLNKANYFIIFNNNFSDPRSNNINMKINLDKRVNIIKVSGLSLSLLTFFRFKNVIFHESIVYFSRFFFKEKKFSLLEKYRNIHKCKTRQHFVYYKIFKFLKIKKFIMIDDYREIQIFINICKKLNIKSIGYMHSRFSKYRVSLKYDCFDKYIVWTDYFKKKLIKINPRYKNKILINNFRNFKKISYSKKFKDLVILFFSDSMMDYKSVIGYLDQLKKKDVKILVRLKSNQYENINFLKYIKNNDLLKTEEKNIGDIIKKYNPNFFLATNSNVLLESTLYNCFPIILKTKNDYSFELIKDKVVIPYSSKNNFYFFLKNLQNKKYLIDKIYNRIWKSTNKNKNLKAIL